MSQTYGKTPMLKGDFNMLQSSFIEITFRHGCSPVKLLHIFRRPFLKDTSGVLLLNLWCDIFFGVFKCMI